MMEFEFTNNLHEFERNGVDKILAEWYIIFRKLALDMNEC